MPKKKPSKTMVRTVRKIAKQETLRLAETKVISRQTENLQLYHNVPVLTLGGGYLKQLGQGVFSSPDQTNSTCRIGNEILLTGLNVKFWLSNKSDRPNCMYRLIMYSHPVGQIQTTLTQFSWTGSGSLPNCMLLRANTNNIRILDQKIIFSSSNYAVDANNHERSQLCTLNYRPKGGRKIKYDDTQGGTGASTPKDFDITVVIACYDAYGTLTTDNIASFATNYSMQFKDL